MKFSELNICSLEELQKKLSELNLKVLETREACICALLAFNEDAHSHKSDGSEEGSSFHGFSPQSRGNISPLPKTSRMEGNPACKEMEALLDIKFQQWRQELASLGMNSQTTGEVPPTSGPAQAEQLPQPRMSGAALSGFHPAQAVKLLADQIPSFGGTENEDIEIWLRKVDIVAAVHCASSYVTLLAASSKLVKHARDWYDLDDGSASVSWSEFRSRISARFKRDIPYGVTIRKIDERKWKFSKETFHEYALQKLNLMQRLHLLDKDKNQLLIDGIDRETIRCTAFTYLSLPTDEFIAKISHLTLSSGIAERKSQPVTTKDKKDTPVSPRKSSSPKKSGSEVFCGYRLQAHVKN